MTPHTPRRRQALLLLLGPLLVLLLALARCGGEDRPLSMQGVRKYGIPDAAPVDVVHVDVGEAGPLVREQPTRPTGTTPRPQAPTRRPGGRAGAYKVAAVEGGATIRGVAKIEKAVEPATIPVSRDRDKCAHAEHPSERLVYDRETRGLANCVVYLAQVAEGKDWPEEMVGEQGVVLDQEKCVYVPHVRVVRRGTQLVVKNSDPAEHNVHGYFNSVVTTLFNIASAARTTISDAPEALLTKEGLVIITCDIHPWMNGYVHVVGHPYHVVTDAEGRFELKDVPPGEYRLVCWHEGMVETPQFKPDGTIGGYSYSSPVVVEQPVTVEAGGEATVEFVVPVR